MKIKVFLASIAVVAAAIMGCAAPTPTAPHDHDGKVQAEDGSWVDPSFYAAAPVTAAPVVAAPVINEDDPAWDCLTMGNRTCGANPIQRVEAWGLFRTDSLTPSVLDGAFRVTYRGIALDDGLAGGSLQIPSPTTPGKVHVFDVEVIK